MCGIIAAVNHDLSEEDVRSLRHRGPDGKGLKVFQVGPHKVSLGHRRLAIVDLSDAGAQPKLTPDGDGCLIFNGEIYNHARLRKLVDEYRFRGHSDTETLLYLLHKYGTACLGWLNGIFGLSYLDLRSRKLLLARDRFGVKPLYWCGNERRLAVSSEIRGLSALSRHEISIESLALLLLRRHVPSPRTLWKDIWKTPPGHFVEVALDAPSLHFEVKPFFGLDPAHGGEVEATGHAAIDIYAKLLDGAIARQLMADVEVGIFLSGGLDSALTAACVRRQLGAGVRAYTVGYEEQSSADEIGDAQRIATHLGLRHRVVRISERSFLESFAKIAEVVEEPVAASSMIPLYALAGLASQDVKVVLSGQGADELLGGYSRYQAARAVQFLLSAGVGRPVGAAMARTGRYGPARQVAAALSGDSALKSYHGLTELFTPAETQRLLGTTAGSGLDFIPPAIPDRFQPRSGDFTNFVMDRDAQTSLPDELLMYTDKVTMHFSLECRVPFLDLELAAFLQSLRSGVKVGILKRKKLQHALVRRWLPGMAISRKKNGFFVPSSAWFGEAAAIRGNLLSQSSVMATFFDMSEVKNVVRQRDLGVKSDKHLFMLAAIGLWLDRHYRPAPLVART